MESLGEKGDGDAGSNEGKAGANEGGDGEGDGNGDSRDSVFVNDFELFAEVMPVFPGGNGKMTEYIRDNIEFPEEAHDFGGGNVFVEFIVDKEGNVTKVKVLKSARKYLNSAAVAVVAGMPKWSPGLNKSGRRVRVKQVVPIKFKIQR